MNNSGKPIRFRVVIIFAILVTAGLIVSLQLDRPVYRMLEDERWRETDWVRMFRVMGYLPLWLLAGTAVVLVEKAWRRGLLIAGAATLAGGVGELLKLLIRRVRPGMHDGMSRFQPWSEFSFNTAGLSTPSSHAIVAFGAAWMLCRLYPRATPVWLLLAVGCAMTRVLCSAHFVSDVYLSAVIAWGIVWVLWRICGSREVNS